MDFLILSLSKDAEIRHAATEGNDVGGGLTLKFRGTA